MTARLHAYIQSEDARAQAAFYAEALGGEIRSAMTYGEIPGAPEESKDKVMHMVLSVAGDNLVFLADSPFGAGRAGRVVSLSLTFGDVADARRSFENLSQGGTVKSPFGLQLWGGYYGEIEDKFGVYWMIVKQ